MSIGHWVALMSCNQDIPMNRPIDNLTNSIISTHVEQPNIKIDSSVIANKIISKNINRLVCFEKDTFSLPFNYYIKMNSKSEFNFMWQLGDLKIDSQSDNYFSFGFENLISFRNMSLCEGNMHFIRTDNKEAITISKVKKQFSDVDEIYYWDNQSLIYRSREIINTLFFQYIDYMKAYAVYLSYNDYLWFSVYNDVTLEQKLNIAISQLTFAKQFFKIEKTHLSSEWKNYEENLTTMNLITINECYEEIKNATNSSIYNEFIRLEKMNISVMNLQSENSEIWHEIQNYYSHEGVDSANIPKDLKGNYEDNAGNHIVQIDTNSIILYLNGSFDTNYFATIVRTKIHGKDVILATKNIESWIYNDMEPLPKEMAIFYKELFYHFGRL